MLNRAFGSPNRQQRELLLLTSACLLKLAVGQTVSGPVYANHMRSAFALKQSELNVAMMMQCSGNLLMLVSGLLYDRWGTRVTVAVGGVASTVASLAVTLAFAFPAALRGRPWSLWLLFFVYGHTFNYADLVAMAIVMNGFPSDRHGRGMAVLDNCFTLGAPLSALVHYLILGNISRPPESQSAVGVLAVQTVLTAGAHAFALAFAHQPGLGRAGAAECLELGERTPILVKHDPAASGQLPPWTDEEASSSAAAAAATEEEEVEDDEEEAGRQQTRRQSAGDFMRAAWSACTTAPYMLLLLTFTFSYGQSLAVWLNITTVTRSLGLSSQDVLFFWVPVALGVAWRSLLGPVSDRYFAAAHERAATMLACLAAFGSPALLLITVPMPPGASQLGVALSSYVLSSLLVASLFTLAPVLLAMTSPQPVLGRLYSVYMFAGTALALPLSLQSGLLYDDRRAINGTAAASAAATMPTTVASYSTCAGHECYASGNIANSACHFASLLCLLGLVALLRGRRATA